MSIKSEAIWAPVPTTERGKPTQISASPDGKRIAYATNKSIFVRSIDAPAEGRQYTEHNAATTVARFSPSGYYIASGDATGTVKVWDCVGDGLTKGSYQVCRSVIDLAWDGESQRIVAVGDGKERFGAAITADSGNSVGEISGQTAQINCVAVKPNRPFRAATGSDDTTLAFYHGAPYKFTTSLRGHHNRYVYGAQFSPDGALLVSVGADRKIWLYDGKSGEPKVEIGADEHKGSIFSVSWAKDSKRFVTASADQTVKIWDAESGKCEQTWRLGPEGAVSVPHHQVGVVWTPRPDDLIISVSLSGDLNYLKPGSDKPVRVVQAHQASITAISPENGATTLWTGDSDGRVCEWKAPAGEATTIGGEKPGNLVSGLSGSSGGKVAAVSWDDKLRLVGSGAFAQGAASTDGSPCGVAQAGTTGLNVVATHKGVAVFRDGQQASWHAMGTSSPKCVDATDKLVAVGADDSSIQIFGLNGDKLAPLKSLPAQASQPTALRFSPSAAHLAVGFGNGKITVLKTADWEPDVTRWTSHTARVTSIAWAKDGKFAVSGSLDCSVRVWSVDKPGTRIHALNAHKEGCSGVAWVEEAGDKRKCVSTGADAAVKLWQVEGLN